MLVMTPVVSTADAGSMTSCGFLNSAHVLFCALSFSGWSIHILYIQYERCLSINSMDLQQRAAFDWFHLVSSCDLQGEKETVDSSSTCPR